MARETNRDVFGAWEGMSWVGGESYSFSCALEQG